MMLKQKAKNNANDADDDGMATRIHKNQSNVTNKFKSFKLAKDEDEVKQGKKRSHVWQRIKKKQGTGNKKVGSIYYSVQKPFFPCIFVTKESERLCCVQGTCDNVNNAVKLALKKIKRKEDIIQKVTTIRFVVYKKNYK